MQPIIFPEEHSQSHILSLLEGHVPRMHHQEAFSLEKAAEVMFKNFKPFEELVYRIAAGKGYGDRHLRQKGFCWDKGTKAAISLRYGDAALICGEHAVRVYEEMSDSDKNLRYAHRNLRDAERMAEIQASVTPSDHVWFPERRSR